MDRCVLTPQTGTHLQYFNMASVSDEIAWDYNNEVFKKSIPVETLTSVHVEATGRRFR